MNWKFWKKPAPKYAPSDYEVALARQLDRVRERLASGDNVTWVKDRDGTNRGYTITLQRDGAESLVLRFRRDAWGSPHWLRWGDRRVPFNDDPDSPTRAVLVDMANLIDEAELRAVLEWEEREADSTFRDFKNALDAA